MRPLRRVGRVRLVLGLVSVGALASGTLVLAVDGNAGASVDPGQGSSYAQSLSIAPHEGSLSTGVTLGEAIAGHTNTFARAQSQGIDLGSIGLTLTSGQTCGRPAPFTPDQIPEPLQTETGAPGAAQGVRQDPTTPAAKPGNPPPSFGANEFVQAKDSPYGEADTGFGSLDETVFAVSGMSSRAWSGVVNGERVAGAVSDVASLSLVKGLVTLGGLHWESTYPTGGSGKPTASFSIGRLLINGAAVPLNQSLDALQSAINGVLGKLGINLALPVVSADQGIESVSPLQLLVSPNDTRDGLIGAVNQPTQPLQQAVLGGLENGFPSEPSSIAQIHCPSVTPITVTHIVIASIDGGGFFSAGFGGVNASTSEIPQNQFSLGTLGVNLNVPGTSQFIPGTAGTPGTLGVAGPALADQSGSTATPPSIANPGGSQSATGVRRASATGTSAGGPLLGIGLGGLGLLALLAESDRRKMRRALRSTTFEE